jgi:glutathione S-transferase
MQLIGMLDSPYVRRVAITLIAAKVPFTHRPISLFRHIDEFQRSTRSSRRRRFSPTRAQR